MNSPSSQSRPFILASASPRRKKLLTEAGFKFTVVVSAVDESAYENTSLNSTEYAKILALAKAKDVAQKYPDELVVGADTVVDFKGETIGKAAHIAEAEAITKKLFSAVHKVITAVAVVRMADNTEIVETDSTTIFPRKLTAEQIATHISGKNWQNRAGAYGIKENGDEFVESINGSVTNAMGMPMELFGRIMVKTAE